jgi:hypothetical protein
VCLESGFVSLVSFVSVVLKVVASAVCRRRPLIGTPSQDYPLPMNGIFVAITVMNCTLASRGSPAM